MFFRLFFHVFFFFFERGGRGEGRGGRWGVWADFFKNNETFELVFEYSLKIWCFSIFLCFHFLFV